jgi:large subunit ribosomal protein L30
MRGLSFFILLRMVGRMVNLESEGKVAKLYITLIKSEIGYAEDQRRTLKALGLRRLHQSVKHDDSPSIRGMIAKVRHLVKVEEREE